MKRLPFHLKKRFQPRSNSTSLFDKKAPTSSWPTRKQRSFCHRVSDIKISDIKISDIKTKHVDICVIGAGSAGLSFSRELKTLSPERTVAIVDKNLKLGGTCVNVGCIPKKLFHFAAMKRDDMHSMRKFQWNFDENSVSLDFPKLSKSVDQVIRGMNFGYRSDLRKKNIDVINGNAQFVTPNQVRVLDAKGKVQMISADKFIISTGSKPNILPIENGNLAKTSDDLFNFQENFFPSPTRTRTLILGGGYIALETAGFLNSFFQDQLTVLTRSPTLLRSFDQDMAELVRKDLTLRGVDFQVGQIDKLAQQEDGSIDAIWSSSETQQVHRNYDVILQAIGRTANTTGMNLHEIGVETDPTSQKIKVSSDFQSSQKHIYALGDCTLPPHLELATTAIYSGRYLAAKLADKDNGIRKIDWSFCPTTVFTPIEYSCVGLSETDAIQKLGQENVEVFHSYFQPLDWTLEQKNDHSYVKIICDKKKDLKIIGLHLFSQNSGEILQGFSVAISQGLTYQQLSSSIPIHPISAEEILALKITKSSGEDPIRTSC